MWHEARTTAEAAGLHDVVDALLSEAEATLETKEARVTAANKGGLECEVAGLRGFMPTSLVSPWRIENLAELVGQEGQVVTDLRPVGVVRINGVKHDAMSQTRLVRAGETVRVVAVDGPTVKVRPLA